MRSLPKTIEVLWDSLPERYQSIYGFEDSYVGKRPSSDRLEIIRKIANALSELKGSPLRILDVGASQGYFSIGLALDGHQVTAIDNNVDNIDLIQALSEHYSIQRQLHCRSQDINDFVKNNAEKFDLVLCFSVLHHEYWKNGSKSTSTIIEALRKTCDVGIFEMALREEPLYWNTALPASPIDDFLDYLFIDELALVGNHLSEAERPIFLASDRFLFINGEIRSIEDVLIPPHPFVDSKHRRRRAFAVDENLVKFEYPSDSASQFWELEREHGFISSATNDVKVDLQLPKVVSFNRGKFVHRLIRTSIPGKRLDQVLDNSNSFQLESAVLEHLQAWAKHHLYPNDLRPWNLIVRDDGKISYIDYGRSSNFCNDANDIDCLFAVIALLIYIKKADPASFSLDLEKVIGNCLEVDSIEVERSWNEHLIGSLAMNQIEILRLLSSESVVQLNALRETNFRITQERDALTQERDALTQERDALTLSHDLILGSKSWRLTKPFRWIMSKLFMDFHNN